VLATRPVWIQDRGDLEQDRQRDTRPMVSNGCSLVHVGYLELTEHQCERTGLGLKSVAVAGVTAIAGQDHKPPSRRKPETLSALIMTVAF